jgi:PAS domain S-box-containing protein
MDWFSIASALCERQERATVLLDGEGRVLLFNRAMESALGYSRFEVQGRSWIEACVWDDDRPQAERWLKEALRGAIQRQSTVAVTRAGSFLEVDFEFSLLSAGTNQALLATAQKIEPRAALKPPGATRGIEYEVHTSGEFGLLRRVFQDGEVVPLKGKGARCFSLVHGRDEPCPHCPLLKRGPWPRCEVRAVSADPDSGSALKFEVTVAEDLGNALARVRVSTMSESVLTAMHLAKLDQVAARGNLSLREQQVVRQLMLGLSIDEIAEVLEISPRTVKFHQANLLQKLGADSRVDLLRVIF